MQYLGVVVQRGFGGAVDAPARHGVATRARRYIQYAAVGLQGLYGPQNGRSQQDDAGDVKVESGGDGCSAVQIAGLVDGIDRAGVIDKHIALRTAWQGGTDWLVHPCGPPRVQ